MSVGMMNNTLGPMPQAVDVPSLSSLFLSSHPFFVAVTQLWTFPGQPSGTLVLKVLSQIGSGCFTQ